MITCTKIRELDLLAPPAPGRPLYLSAASGLVRVQSRLFVLADDELHLGVFDAEGSAPGHLIRLFAGALPEEKAERKKRKPDLEALAFLPASPEMPFGALFALGSGSTPERCRGVVVALDAQGGAATPRPLDLTPLLEPLAARFSELNIEGVTIDDRRLCLVQRGSRPHPENAVIAFAWPDVFRLLRGEASGPIEPVAVHLVDLGEFRGVPFSFTDAASLPGGGTIFTAVAEDTDNAYDDGPCVAASVGYLDADLRLRWMRGLDHPHKVEGIEARRSGNRLELLLVTDPDDPSLAASLLSAATTI